MTATVTKAQGRTLDRIPEPSRNAEYPVRTLTEQRATTRTRIVWTPGTVLDQGEDGACVAFAWTQEALTSPVRVDLAAVNLPRRWSHDPEPFAKRLYWAAQRHDEWEGGAYPGAVEVYDGTSVVSGARQMVRLGFLREYRWAFTTGEVRDALLTLGPVVFGCDWHDGMFDAPGGVVRVSGAVVGGHCVVINGYQPDRDLGGGPEAAFRIQNSWGAGWGDGQGGAWMSEPDLATLLADQGEAAVPTARSYGHRANG